MALQVWLPLNGKIDNQGLDTSVMSGSPASWGNGLLGKCAAFTGGQIIKTNSTHALDYLDNFSWACWVNTAFNSSGDKQQYIFTVGRVDYGSYGYSLLCSNSSTCSVRFGTSVYNIPVAGGTWTHIAFTKQGTDIKIYLNSALQVSATFAGTAPTYTESVGLGVGCFHYSGGDIYKYNGSVCDFRIYDNVLSPKEIHEIAQGLCLHYPLNDPVSTASLNKYRGDNFEGKPSSSSYTMTKLANERGYNFKLNYTGDGNNTWPNIQFPTVSFTAGKTYDYSCKVRAHSANFGIYFRAARMGNDWVTSMRNVMACDSKWHEYHFQLKLEAKSERSGTEYDTHPLIEFYSKSLSTKDKVYTCDFDLKDIQICECNTAASVSNGAWVDNTVYDTSGFGNHGSVVAANAPKLAGASPRYDMCYEFEYKHYITGKMPFNGQAVSAFTVSAWINQIEGGGYSTWMSSGGYGGSGLWLAVNTEGCGQWAFRGSVSPNYVKGGSVLKNGEWHLFTYVYNAGLATWYLDGKKNVSATYSDNVLTAASTFALGDSFTGNTWNTNFHGKISDLRIYGTALSDADIAALYNTPVSIASNGAMILKGEVIEA